MFDLVGGPHIIKARYVINTFKFLTFFFCLYFMNEFNNYSLGAYLYLAIHGSYGMLWLTKDIAFPDSSWEGKMTIFACISGCGLLSAYWYLPYMMMSGLGH